MNDLTFLRQRGMGSDRPVVSSGTELVVTTPYAIN